MTDRAATGRRARPLTPNSHWSQYWISSHLRSGMTVFLECQVATERNRPRVAAPQIDAVHHRGLVGLNPGHGNLSTVHQIKSTVD